MPIRQSEIYVFVPDSQMAAAAGGGLLFALVDAGVNSVRTSKAEAAVRPLRDAIVDYDFDSAMRDALKSDLSQVAWIHAGTPRVIKDASSDGVDRVLNASTASDILVAALDYRLSNDADALTITMSVALYPKDDALIALRKGGAKSPASSIVNSIYRNKFTYQTIPTGRDDRDANIAALSANSGAKMRAALNTGVKELAGLLATDLQHVQGGPDVLPADQNGATRRDQTGALTFNAEPLP